MLSVDVALDLTGAGHQMPVQKWPAIRITGRVKEVVVDRVMRVQEVMFQVRMVVVG